MTVPPAIYHRHVRAPGRDVDILTLTTIKLNGLDPYFTLRYILTKLPATPADRLVDLLPWNLDPDIFHELTAEDARISLASIPIDRQEL
jgi:hypothetical protein